MQDFDILFVDDDRAILELVKEFLNELGYRIHVCDSGPGALALIKERSFDIVFTDFKMPDIDGLELLEAIKEYRPETEVIIVTGHGTMESAVKAMRSGSYDYLQKPFKLDVLKIIIDRIIEEKRLKQANIVLKKRLKPRHRYDLLVGISLKMQEIYESIERMRQHDPHVIVQGESGSGKELTAQVIHRTSARSRRPLQPLACKRLARDLPVDRLREHLAGVLAAADGGTLFLDELVDIPVEAQRRLAELVAEGAADVRIIAATAHDLQAALQRGVLVRELLQPLKQEVIRIPPLRDRKEDLCLLINHFLDRFNARHRHRIYNVSPAALDYLMSYGWPGNVIQLENVIERAFALGAGPVIDVDDLPVEIRAAGEISKMN